MPGSARLHRHDFAATQLLRRYVQLSTGRDPHRNAPGNAQDYHRVGVYEQSVPLDSTATVVGVILPSLGQGGSGAALHVFGLAIG